MAPHDRNVQKGLGQDLAESHHDEQVRCQFGHMPVKCIRAHRFGLQNRDNHLSAAARLTGGGVSLRPLPLGRSGWVTTASTSMVAVMQGLQRRYGKIRRAHKDDVQCTIHCCFISFLTRRLYICRFKVLM
jgi:hypothetical protein